MKRARIKFALVVAAAAAWVGTVAVAADDRDGETLTGFEEVPALSTPGWGVPDLGVALG